MQNKIDIGLLSILINTRGSISYNKLFKNNKINITNLIKLVESNIINIKPSNIGICISCNNDVKISSKIGDLLLCSHCNNLIDLSIDKNIYYFSSYRILKPGIQSYFSTLLNFSSTNIEDIDDNVFILGEIIDKNIFIFLVKGKLSAENILSIIGFLSLNYSSGVLLYVSKNSETDIFLEQNLIRNLSLIELNMSISELVIKFKDHKSMFIELSYTSNWISQIVNSKVQASIPTLKEGWIDSLKISNLSSTGGYKFEEPAISLFWSFGIPLLYKGAKERPEGILLHYDNFWLIDAKSSKKAYSFSMSERDKIKRYIDNFGKAREDYPNFSPSCICIVTREIEDKTVKKVLKYLKENSISGKLLIFLLPGLISLFENIQQNPEYWYRFNIKTHIPKLINGGSLIGEAWSQSRQKWNTTDSELLVIDTPLLNAFFAMVISSPVVFDAKFSDFSNILDIIENMNKQYT